MRDFDGFVGGRWWLVILGGVAAGVAGLSALATLYGAWQRPGGRSAWVWVAGVLALAAVAVVVASIPLPQLDRAILTPFVGNETTFELRLSATSNAFYVVPVALAFGALVGALASYWAAPQAAAGWCVAVATSTVLYAAGIVKAADDFGWGYRSLTPGQFKDVSPDLGTYALFAAGALLILAACALAWAARRERSADALPTAGGAALTPA
jgi:hypothetical protein